MKPWIIVMRNGLTRNYHSGGAALVWANDKEDAERLLRAYVSAQEDRPRDDFQIFSIHEASSLTDPVEIFPDAGCC